MTSQTYFQMGDLAVPPGHISHVDRYKIKVYNFVRSMTYFFRVMSISFKLEVSLQIK